ncbi:MAG: hypothetical protein ISS91_04775 [Candidatus Omnitrophica bacterium]|nr:hypothetical protein [Candidatus Omnitrophota bacterium]
MKKYGVPVLIVTLLLSVVLSGCGETVKGICRDTKRVGKGVKTVFIRED